MDVRLFRLDRYLSADDAYHAVLSDVPRRRPAYLHHHDFHELMVVLEGPLTHHVDGRDESLPGGTAVFLRPADRHLLHSPRGGRARILNVMFRSEVCDALLSRHHAACAGRFWWTGASAPETLSLAPAVRETLVRKGDALQDGPRAALRLDAFLTGLLADLTTRTATFDAGLPAWLARACRAAAAPEIFRDGAAGLVRVSGRSHEHVCRAMRRHLDTSPSAYVNGLRMDHAARLVRDGNASLAEIAADLGIANPGHFHRLFKDRHGMTPLAYRRRAEAAPV